MLDRYSNSAGKILELFRKLREDVDYAEDTLNSTAVIDVWRTVLRIATDSTEHVELAEADVINHLAKIHSTFCEIENDIIALRPLQAKFYLPELHKLKNIVRYQRLEQPAKPILDLLSVKALGGLECCAIDLPKDEITEDEIEQFRTAAEELFSLVEKSKLRKPLKTWLLLLLSAIKKSIDNYQIYGAKGFRESLSTVVGEIVLHKEALQEVKQEEEAIESGLFGLVEMLKGLAEKAKQYEPLLEYSGRILEIASSL